MREIKFRAWVYGTYFYNVGLRVEHNQTHIFLRNEAVTCDVLPNDGVKCFLEQFTGLHDKNGKEIYKGDICYAFSSEIEPIIVISHLGSFGYMNHDGIFISFAENYHYMFDSDNKSQYIKVIGNIHENPELMESK